MARVMLTGVKRTALSVVLLMAAASPRLAFAGDYASDLRAGDRALAASALDRAEAAYQASVADGGAPATDVAGRLALVAWTRGDCAAQEPALGAALASATDAGARVALEVRLAQLALVQGRHREVGERVARALPLLATLDASRYDRGPLLVLQAFAAFADGDAAAGAAAHAASLPLQAKRIVVDPVEVALRQANRGFAALHDGDGREALRNFDLARGYIRKQLGRDYPALVVVERGRAAALDALGKKPAAQIASKAADALARTAVCRARTSRFRVPD
jgi:hypothetical protein